jgi:hypothetical protein
MKYPLGRGLLKPQVALGTGAVLAVLQLHGRVRRGAPLGDGSGAFALSQRT